MVKNRCARARMKYLKELQKKGTKGYADLLLAPAEGLFQAKKSLLCGFGPF